jgi:hypothetical protein
LNDEEIFGDNLVDLEYETMSNLSDFIEELKGLLLHEKMIQSPEIMVSYLCAYKYTINDTTQSPLSF